MHKDTVAESLKYFWIAIRSKKVEKTGRRPNVEPKPFKSGNKINTVRSLIRHPKLGNLCYTFYEDDSYVECWRCRVAEQLTV